MDNSAWLVALLILVVSALLLWMLQRRIQALVMAQQALLRETAALAASLKDTEARLERQQRHAPIEARRVREDTLRLLLPVDDHVQRACAHLDDADLETLQQGYTLLAKDLDRIWRQHDVVRLRPDVGADFDPHHHEAIATRPPDADDVPAARGIAYVARDGFLYHETLLRPAQVVVWQSTNHTSSAHATSSPSANNEVAEEAEPFDVVNVVDAEVGVS